MTAGIPSWRGRPGKGNQVSANAQVTRQAEIRELPVYFFVSSWPTALGRASVVATGIASRRGTGDV
jgi:hypothetical protein